MIKLRIIKDSDVFSTITENKVLQRRRKAARAIVFDDTNKIALLFVKKHGYHKLPGGGIEEKENIVMALNREMLEEIGCQVEIVGEAGEIIEYRAEHDLIQTNYIYSAKVIGGKGKPDFTEEEIADGFEIVWLSLDEAIKTLENDKTEDYQGNFILIRDLNALKTLRRKMEKFEIRTTGLRGKGAFATSDIKAGEKITEFTGEIVDRKTIHSRIVKGEEHSDDPLQIDDDKFMDIDNDAYFFNHSCDPNAGIRGIADLVAIKDIKAGEEITFDYSTTVGTNVNNWRMECLCGAPNCRKVIANVTTIPTEQLEKYRHANGLQEYILKQLDK